MLFRSISIVLIWLVTFNNVFAQTQKDFIELTVSDTIALHLVSIEYVIGFNQYAYAENYDENGNFIGEPNRMLDDMKSLKSDLSRAGFQYEHVPSEVSYDLPRAKSGVGSLKFKFKNQKELIKLLDTVSDVKHITGSISVIEHEPFTDVLKQRLYNKIYDKASRDANMMAGVSKRKAGKVISVVHLNGESGGSQNMFANMFSAFAGGGSSQDDSFRGSSSMTCTFRFELID